MRTSMKTKKSTLKQLRKELEQRGDYVDCTPYGHIRAGRAGMEARTGMIYPKKTLFLRYTFGECSHGRKKYEISTTVTGEPLVRSNQTGKWFLLRWQDVVMKAQEAGIDRKDKA